MSPYKRHGIDYNEIFSPTFKSATLRIVLALAAQHDLKLRSIDFSTAFLNGGETFQSDAPNISANEVEDCIGVLRHIYRGNKVKSINQTKPAFINLCYIMQVKDRQGVPYLL